MTSIVTPESLYQFILENTEEIDGQLICRVSLIAELRRRGVSKPGPVRANLVRELTKQGLVVRPHPRSRWLIVTSNKKARSRLREIEHERFGERMGALSGPGAITIHSSRIFEHDAVAARQRAKRLSNYLTSNVLDGKKFVCSSWKKCESSIGAGCTFKEGQLSHLGKHYDISRGGKPVRVLVVGQEVAAKGKARTTMAERYARVHDGSGLKLRFDGDRKHKRRNPHMRGTTLALRTIFDLPGTDHSSEFLDLDGEAVHIFDCFALVNRLLCAAHLKGTSTGKPTKTMFRNCERHFQNTLEILEPTIVVVQGIKVWKRCQHVLVPVKQRGQNLFECELAGSVVTVAAFTHPSAWGADRWDSPTSPYFKNVVRPTLKRAVRLT